MPYANPEKQKAYQKEYKRNLRQNRRGETAGIDGNPPCSPIRLFKAEEAPFRIQTAKEILNLLEEVTNKTMTLETRGLQEAFQQIKIIGYLAGLALKAVETADLEDRLEAVETVLKMRRAG